MKRISDGLLEKAIVTENNVSGINKKVSGMSIKVCGMIKKVS